jgi:homoaconitate hydratase
MGATVVEKIARAHMVEGPARELRPGDMLMLRPRHLLTHDNTSAVMSKFKGIGAARVHDPRQPVFALDHEIQNDSAANLEKYGRIEAFAEQHGIDFHPAGCGIGHQIMIEQGYALPGTLVVASDSHSNMYGAVGALGTPVVRTDAASIWATGSFWWQIPRTVQVVLDGELRPGVTGKDVILALCALYNRGEVLNAAVEFAGPGVASLDMSARMSIANMTTEWGALTGWFPVDAVTVEYLRGRAARLAEAGIQRFGEAELAAWQAAPPAPDADAAYAARIKLDLATVPPFIAGPDDVLVGRPAVELEAEHVAIDRAYLLSCVNGRLEDFEAAAEVLRGRRVAEGVRFYIAAASSEVQGAAEASGAWDALLAAGATPLPPGCGPCIGLGDGLLEDGEVGISATNRNFKGRMGARSARVYLASPRVVAASAAAGRIATAIGGGGMPERSIELPDAAPPPDEEVEIVPGFPARHVGRLLFIPRDNLNTDGIYGKDHTYRELPREEMAAVVMQNYDPSFAAQVREGDVLVGARNFGTGSSREQAATALQAAGIALVIADSFSQTYLRNAFNNGFICVECPAFVEAVAHHLEADVAAGAQTVVPGDDVEIDFSRGSIQWRGSAYRFPALGTVPQGLVVAGGIEQQVRQQLGLVQQPA